MTGTPRRGRPVGVAFGLILIALIVLVFFGLDRGAPLHYYRPINDNAISVGTISGPNTWTRVTGVTETDSSVTVYVKSLSAPLPGTGDDVYELTVLLANPLAGRAVIDGTSGLALDKLAQPTP